VARLEEAVAEPQHDAALAARTLSQLAWQRGAWLGDVETAIPEATRAVALAELVAEEGTLVTALTTLGLLLSISGDRRAEATFRRAVAILDRAPSAAGDHTPHLAFAHERWWRGAYGEAAALIEVERQRALDQGDEGRLMRVAIFGARLEARRGRWTDADRLLEEALLGAQGWWRISALVERGILRGRRGERSALDDAAELRASPHAAGDPAFRAAAGFIEGLTRLADGDAAAAADLLATLLEETAGHAQRGVEFGVLIPEAVAALAAGGQVERALALTKLLDRRSAQFGAWGLAAGAYCRGVLALAAADIPAAREELAAAARGFEDIGAPWELGQSLLAEGSTLRRAGRRLEAGRSLDRALAIFTELGAEPARRAAAEELRRVRPQRARDDSLTPAEGRVAALAAAGQTNREVAARLFTTVATVEAHLTRIYAKLGVRSRTELARRVSDGSLQLEKPADPAPAAVTTATRRA
jgi:DNA-binding CsgD family transcriptional regulator